MCVLLTHGLLYSDRECHSYHSTHKGHTFTVDIINIERFFALIGFIDKKNWIWKFEKTKKQKKRPIKLKLSVGIKFIHAILAWMDMNSLR